MSDASERISNEVNHGSGSAVLPMKDVGLFGEFRSEFLKRAADGCEIDTLRQKMKGMSNADINKLMIQLLGFADASETVIRSCPDIVSALSGTELFVQRRANIIMNFPGDDQRHQWPHYELMSGVSPFTYVLWAPLHDLDDDGGMFYLDDSESHEIMQHEFKSGLVNSPKMFEMVGDRKPLKIKYGEVVVFNPFVLHGNSYFKSELSRIAVSVRFQSLYKPIMQKNSDYFKVLRLDG